MAEQTQSTELASKPSINTGGGLISNIGDTLDKIKRLYRVCQVLSIYFSYYISFFICD